MGSLHQGGQISLNNPQIGFVLGLEERVLKKPCYMEKIFRLRKPGVITSRVIINFRAARIAQLW